VRYRIELIVDTETLTCDDLLELATEDIEKCSEAEIAEAEIRRIKNKKGDVKNAQAVSHFSRYAAAAPGLKYDQKKVLKLNEEISGTEEKISGLQEKLSERSEELHSVEKELNNLINDEEEDRLACQTTLDLEMACRKLECWIKTREENRNAAMAALALFEDIEREEEQKVSSLFGAESSVSAYFHGITGGLYRAVHFDTTDDSIKIVRSNGLVLDARQLSGGAYDQLYFAIRLALGEKLLEGEKGFFILDDPFIKADPLRLDALLSMLFQICKVGWQILYFSSKGEIRQTLEDKITAGEVREILINPDGKS